METLYKVNIERIERDLYELRKFGYNPADRGIYRPGLTEPDMEARRWLMEQFSANGLETHMDGAGNVIGRRGAAGKPAIAVGSHSDTVPCGGMFDGALGVIAGLECIRVMNEEGIETENPIEVISTSEEEGRFGGMLGAQALAGALTPDWIERAESADGELLKEALEKCGLSSAGVLRSRLSPGALLAFLELHIEQGPILDKERIPIGIVEGISGVFKWLIRLKGKADHAGTAPMNMRSDAFMGLADFAHEIYRIIDENGSDKSRLTIGRVELKPGYAHTIPGEVDFTLVGRDLDERIMFTLAEACRKVLSSIARKHKLMFEYEERSWLSPQDCHESVISAFEESAKQLGLPYKIMPSGAGHDVQFFSKLMPAGMVFVPSVNGVSHAPDEWTQWEDVENGANVLLNTLVRLSQQKQLLTA
ncbi:Zn-dependent hydrolase [Anseongella ginsenosidimutans]|nr:Zn-dependent hydrolase [Anseongella ginsenosidimutans]QEC52711.1 Zn-dependent hydrolase [Anseongella ginsenosidimutans]